MTGRVANAFSVLVGLAVLVVLAVIGAIALQFVLGLLQEGGQVAETVNFVLIAALGGLGYLYRSSRDKRRDLEQQLASSKRDLYGQYVTVLKDVAGVSQGGKLTKPEVYVDRLRTFAFSSTLIASDPVVRAHIRFTNLERIAPGNASVVVAAVGDVLLALRRDIGFADTKLSNRDLLGVFVKEIDDDRISAAVVEWETAKAAWDKRMGWSS